MRLDRLTERSQEALQAAEQAASSLGHAQIDPEHLLLALLHQEEGLVPALWRRLEITPEPLAAKLQTSLEARPRQVGGGQPQISSALRQIMLDAFEEMNRLKDE